MTTKTYELKNATFTAEVGTASDVRALSDAQIAALVRNAMANWSFRRGARKESDGKNYSFAEVVADMLAVGERSSGPSKDDVALAEKLFFDPNAGALPRNATEADKDAVLARAIAKYAAANDDFAFTADPDSAALDNAAEFLAARRRHIARRTKGESLL
jgi:hypothetical protein